MKSRWFAKLALALISAGLAIGAAEVGLRVANVDLNTNPRMRYHPDLGWTISPAYRRYDYVNAEGFRHQIPREKPPGTRRLVILGDSFSFAGAYPFARTYAGLLDQWLGDGGAASGPGGEPWEVVNLGVSGYGTGQELLALREYGLSFDPDAVVLQMFPFNDLCNNNLLQAFTCSFLDFHRPYWVMDGDELRVSGMHPVRSRLRRFSRLFGWIEVRTGWGIPVPEVDKKGRAMRTQYLLRRGAEVGLSFESNHYSLAPAPDQPDVIRAGWEVTERIVEEIAATVEARGVPLIGVVVPYFDTLRPTWPGLKPKGHPPLVADHATATAERLLGDAGASVISVRARILAGEREARDYFFPRRKRNDKHLNDFGHFMVATWLLEELRALDLSDRTAPPPPARHGRSRKPVRKAG